MLLTLLATYSHYSMDWLHSLWSTELRAGPIALGIGIFAMLAAFRRWTSIQYVPMYFIFFPAAVLDREVAYLYGLGPITEEPTPASKSRLKRRVLIASILTIIGAFVLIPGLVGGTAAVFMNRSEFAALLFVVVTWQAYCAFHSTLDNALHTLHPKASSGFFASLYFIYLLFLVGTSWASYRFVEPFAAIQDYVGFASAAWDAFFGFIALFGLAAVVAGIASYLLTEQEIARPEWLRRNDADSPEKREHR